MSTEEENGPIEFEKEHTRAEAEKLESARKFKAMSMALEDISKGLGLSIEEIKKL